MQTSEIKIALLSGGASPEREVSKSSSRSIYNALLELGYKVKVFDPAFGIDQPENVEDLFGESNGKEINYRNYIKLISSDLFSDINLVFIGLHGKWGEDGTLQSLLELQGIKYTGPKVLASAVAMDKIMTKIVLKHHGVSTPEWISLNSSDIDIEGLSQKINNTVGYPCVVKPNDSGSTIGLTICNEKSQLNDAVILAFKYSSKVLIEEFIPGRELTVAVLDQTPLPVLEIKPKSGFYDYASKYTKGMTEYIVPAVISDEIALHLQQQALLSFNALGCESYSRVDFRLDNNNKPYVLEVNTLPGMTSTSLVPKMAAVAGISFNELIDRIVKNSINEIK